jgi:hypothetical protein
MISSKVINLFKKLFLCSNFKYKKSEQIIIKKIITKGSALIIDVGFYVSDSGASDYSIDFKVKRGKIYKKCIGKMKKNEDTYMFNKFKLTPITSSVFIRVKKSYLSVNPSNFEIYSILLVKKLPKYKVIKI